MKKNILSILFKGKNMRQHPSDNFLKLEKSDILWMDSSGNIHEIEKMDLWHIYNAVKMLERRNKLYRELKFEEITIPSLMLLRLETEFAEKYPEYMI